MLQEQVYSAVVELCRGTRGLVVTVNDLCTRLDMPREALESHLLALEQRGWVLCAPSAGRIALVGLARTQNGGAP